MIYILFASLLIFSLNIVGAIPAMAADYDVNPGDTIQAAIDAAGSCDTITVAPGTYEESITINKNLKLIAPDGATIKAPATPEDIYLDESSNKYEYAVGLFGGIYDAGTDTVSGDGTITVELAGFTIDANNFVPTDRWASILVRNVNEDYCDGIASIHENQLINAYIDGKETFGILGYGDLDVVISGNTIDGFARGGIGIMSGYVEVIDNVVIGPGLGVPITWAPNGIQVGRGASGLIQGNDVSGCGWPGTDWAGTGILVVDTSYVEVNDNWVHDNEQAIGVVDFPVEFYGPNWPQVVSDISVTHNVLEDNSWGISVANDCDNITVAYNCIRDTVGDAIDVYTYNIYYGDLGILPPTNVDVNYNSIIGNGPDGLWVGPYVTDTVNAVNNWWGYSSGPSGDGPGSGDTVVGNAEYDPWIKSLTYTEGPQPASEVVLEATLIDSNDAGIPGAQIDFYVGGEPVGSASTDTSGVASYTTSLPAGIYNVYAKVACLHSETVLVPVYDPSAGFVTGGGWIDSPAGAAREAAIYNQFSYDDQTLSDWQQGNFDEVFNLTKGDLTLSYTIDMSGITTPGWAVTEVGLREAGGPNIDPNGQGGWMQSNYINGVDTPDDQDLNDFHLLSKHGWSEQYYDADGPESVISPYWSGNNYAFWFDRGGVDPWQDDDPTTPSPGGSAVPWGVGDGVTYNTGGVYDIVITYHAIDATTATMFATINGIPQGLYIGGAKNAEPEFYPAGRTFSGDMTQMQAFFGRGGGGGNVALSNMQVTGPALTVTGKATFGFVSKYKKGANSPDGQTEFVFKAADLNFHSTSYEWLVVTGSDFAKFKGVGTINGEGEYKFQIWAGDNEPDTFRIKIWYEVDNMEIVVYDNGMNQPIGGGNIVVHTSKK